MGSLKEQVQEQEAILSAIGEGSADAITQVDKSLTIITWSPGAERMLGYTRDEMVGQPVGSIFTPEIHEFEMDRIHKQFDGTIGALNVETVRLRKDGTPVHVQMTRIPLKNRAGETTALLAVLKDITEEKLLRKKVDQLERNHAMSKVAAKVAHEIRTPLGVLFLKSDLLVERLDMVFEDWGKDNIESHKKVLEKYITDIQRQVSRLEEIANNYLHLSKSRTMERMDVDVEALLNEMLSEWKEQYKDEDIEWELEIRTNPRKVFLDPQQIQRVCFNLARNSVEAVRSLEDRRKVIGMLLDADEKHVHITLWDKGPGIPKELRETIFDPFTTTKSIGTGLGLYLVEEIVKNHGGDISLDSEEGDGTSVRISIPIEPEKQT
jgi:PAS domain S-box-containing protein